MKQLIIKYTTLLIVTTVILRLITAVLTIMWPDLQIKENPDGSFTTYSFGPVEILLEYLINIMFIVLIRKDLEEQRIKSLPLLIITFFSSFMGVLFFLLISAQNKLNFNKQLS